MISWINVVNRNSFFCMDHP